MSKLIKNKRVREVKKAQNKSKNQLFMKEKRKNL